MADKNINIQRGEGISQAIKRVLIQEENVNANQFTGSIWRNIHAALKNDTESSLQHGENRQRIGQLWSNLNTNVRTYVNDVVTIAESTWNSIKALFTGQGASASASQQPAQPRAAASKPQPASTQSQEDIDRESITLTYGNNQIVNTRLSDAAALLARIANMTPPPQVGSGRDNDEGCDYQQVDLGNDQWIQVNKYDDGRVIIFISNKKYNNNDKDNPEIMFTFDKSGKCTLSYDIAYSDGEWDKTGIAINKPQFNTNLLRIVEKIFGDTLTKGLHGAMQNAQFEQDKAALKTRVSGPDAMTVNSRIQAAEQLLADAANMNPKPQIEKGRDNDNNCDYVSMNINNQWVNVSKYDDGDIVVRVSADSTNNRSEVLYWFRPNGNYSIYVNTIDGDDNSSHSYNFQNANYVNKMKAIVKAIFGNESIW